MTFLGRLSVTKTLIILTVSGFFVALVFAGPQLRDLGQTHRKLQTDANLTQLAFSVGELTHELQKERGASAGFISSQGNNFAVELPAQRTLSDGVIQAFLASSEIALSEIADTSELRDKIESVLSQLAKVPALRRQVDSLSVGVLEAVGQITALNRAAIGLLPEIGQEISYADAARAVQRHSILMTAKDIAGLERATGATAFAIASSAEGVVPTLTLGRFQGLIREQEVLFEIYSQIASDELQSALAVLASSDAAKSVSGLRQILESADPSQILAISPEEWFEEITRKMGLLKQIETLGAQELVDETEEALELSTSKIFDTLALLIVLFLAVGSLTVFFAMRIVSAIKKTTNRIVALADGDIASEVPDVAPSDLSRITTALAVFREKELELNSERERQNKLELSSAAGIKRVSEDVARGDFSSRIRLRDLQGASKVLGDGLNTIMSVAEKTVQDQRERDKHALEHQTAIAEAGQAAIAELREVVSSCIRGDFSQRLRTDDKEGVFAELCEGVNRIGEVTEAGLSEVTDVLEAIAHGDLSKRSSGKHEGIFAEICERLDETAHSLNDLVAQIADGAGIVQSSAAELKSSADDLALRTERNAAALVQTSAAIEQLTASVSSTAEGARKIGQTAQSTEQETKVATEAAAKMVAAIESIASSSSEISKITDVIDDISFQTNLLALNAGVEAARAGDAGKGFAVVASEVRVLAQRAAQAAKDINELISHSEVQVAQGVEIVSASRTTLEDIQKSVRAMTGEFLSMVEAAAEQSSGIGEINRAITEMEQTTQQNAAMFEETSAVVLTMRDQSKVLSSTISRFSTSEEHREEASPLLSAS
ncbi:MAG: nitrate- and nitrite sensing domain-containing protein [Pseudomonadota bacterium]